MFIKTKQRLSTAKQFLIDSKDALWAISDGLLAQSTLTAELTIAVRDLTDRLSLITGPLDYLEKDRRSHNQRAGHTISQ